MVVLKGVGAVAEVVKTGAVAVQSVVVAVVVVVKTMVEVVVMEVGAVARIVPTVWALADFVPKSLLRLRFLSLIQCQRSRDSSQT